MWFPSNAFPIDDDLTTKRAEGYSSRRDNPAGLISRDDPSCGRQGGLTLITTSRTPNMRPAHGAEKLRREVHGRFLPRSWANGDKRRPQVTPIGAGLFVLVVSTTWAVASVSLWWVPVYLGLLVAIFMTPPRRKSPSSASKAALESDRAGITNLGSGLRVDCGDRMDEVRSLTQYESGLTIVEPTEPLDSNLNLSAASSAKRRGRVRVRKAVKPASEPLTDSFPVVWIQVGPGKFVRVEDGIQAADLAPTEEVVSRAYPVAETPAEATPAAPAQTEPPEEQEAFTSSGASLGDMEPIALSDNRALESVTEEHGIAPSAFSLATGHDSSGKSSGHDLPDQVDQSEVKTGPPDEPVVRLPPTQTAPARLLGQPGESRRWMSRIRRGFVFTDPRASRASWRRAIRTFPNSRLVGASRARSVSRRDPARRAIGPMLHAERALRTRSPPRR